MFNCVASRTTRRFRDEQVLRGWLGKRAGWPATRMGCARVGGEGFPGLGPPCVFPARGLSQDQDKPAGQRDVTRAGKGPWWGRGGVRSRRVIPPRVRL